MGTGKTGACLVCGKETTKLCSKCVKAGHDLFFCSPEHQKLVWAEHRRVCGKRLTPEPWPWYSQEEADETIANLDVKRKLWDGRELTMTEYLAEVAQVPKYYTAQHIYDFTAGHNHPFSLFISQAALADFRALEIRRKCPSRNFNDVLGKTDIFQIMHELWLAIYPGTPIGVVWHAGMQHRFVVLFSLLHQRAQDESTIPLAYCRNAYKQIEQYILSPASRAGALAFSLVNSLHRFIDSDTMVLRIPTLDTAQRGQQ